MEPAEVESLLEIKDSSAEAWCDVFRRLMSNKDKINSSEMGDDVCDALIKNVEEIGCKDKYTVWKIVHIVNICNSKGEFGIPDNFHLPLSKLEGDCIHPLYYSIEVNINGNIRRLSLSQMLLALLNSDVEIMRLLLNNGYPNTIGFDEQDTMRKISSEVWLFFTICPELPDHACTDECFRTMYNRLLDPPTNVRRHGVAARGLKRIFLAALCIQVMNDQKTDFAKESFQCLRLYFRAIADPFVQADEFGEVLRFFLCDSSKDFVATVVKDFKRLYPESKEPYSPRSLKHLSRCAVRQNLTHRSEVLPASIDELGPLPPFLKKYIIGDL